MIHSPPTGLAAAPAAVTMPTFAPALPAGSIVRDVFRCGCSYGITARNGAPATLFDLYDRDQIVTGAALRSEVPNIPPPDSVVRIEGIVIPTSGGTNAIWIKSIQPIEVLDEHSCVFEKVPVSWIVDRDVVDRIVAVWRDLSAPYRVFVNAVLRRPSVLEGFLAAPASLRHHHHDTGGCLEHSVQVAEWGLNLAREDPTLAKDLLISCLLLHDCGKAIEYVRNDRGRWRMSPYGLGVGHKTTTLMLVGPALSFCDGLSAAEKHHILHVLAASYAPNYVGLRRPRTREARVMAAIDALSAEVGTTTAPVSRMKIGHD